MDGTYEQKNRPAACYVDGLRFSDEYNTGDHIFQVLFRTLQSLISDQFLPGGNYKLEDSDYRLGFNIYRSFWF